MEFVNFRNLKSIRANRVTFASRPQQWTVGCSRLSWLTHGRAMSSWCYSEMSNWSNSSWCYCHLILGELKIEKSVIRFGGIKSGIKTPAILLVNEPGHCLAFLFRQMSHVKRKLFNSFFATLSSFQNNQKEMKWNGENQALFHTCKKPSHNLCFLVIIGTIFLLLCFS